MLELLTSGTMSNHRGAELTTAVHLANNVREIALGLEYADPQQPGIWADPDAAAVWNTKEATLKEYDNITDLDGLTDTWAAQDPKVAGYDPPAGYLQLSPPVNAARDPIPSYSDWAQWVKVETVSGDDLVALRPHDAAEPTVLVTVKILRSGREVYRTSWVVVSPKTIPPDL